MLAATSAAAGAGVGPPSFSLTFPSGTGAVTFAPDGVSVPNITAVRVSESPAGMLHFAIAIANRARLFDAYPTGDTFELVVYPGQAKGAQYDLNSFGGGSWEVAYRPSGKVLPSAVGGFANGVLSLTIPRSEIHASGTFRFRVIAAYDWVLHASPGPGLPSAVSFTAQDSPRSGHTWVFPTD